MPPDAGATRAVDFNTVYSLFYARILRYLTRLVGPDEAEDVSQEVFSKISRSLGEFRGEALSAWVYRIATNAATDRMRRTAVHLTTAEYDDFASPDTADSAEQQAIRNEMSDCVRDLTNELPDNYRTVLVLSDIEGLKDAEIAEVVGSTVQAVKIRLHRARARPVRSWETAAAFTATAITRYCATAKCPGTQPLKTDRSLPLPIEAAQKHGDRPHQRRRPTPIMIALLSAGE